MPAAPCRATHASNVDGTYLAFIDYDPTFRPSDKTRSTGGFGAHPVIQAWRIAEDLRLEDIPAKSVECTIYSFGD